MSGKQTRIRLLAPDEVEACAAMWRRSRFDAQPWLEERLGYSPEDDLAFFRNTLLEACQVWIALRGAVIVGMLALAPGKIEQLFVEPAQQGSGVGSALLDHAKAREPAGLKLFTHQRNERARVFYEQRGFQAVAFGTSPAPESEPDVEYRWPGASA